MASETLRPLQIELLVEDGPLKGSRFPLGLSGRTTIGRRDPAKEDLNIAIPSDVVSILHATVSLESGQLFVQDHDTTNYTLIRGRLCRGEKLSIELGDVIQIAPPKGPRIRIYKLPLGPEAPTAFPQQATSPPAVNDLLQQRLAALEQENRTLREQIDQRPANIEWAILDPMLADFVSRLERATQQAEGQLQIELRQAAGRLKEIRRLLDRGRRA